MKTRIFVTVICAAALLAAGCENLRKAPTEELKQSAQIQTDLADLINVIGCEPESETSRMLKVAAEAMQLYIGLPGSSPQDRWATLVKARNTAYDPVTFLDVTNEANKWLAVAEAIATPQVLALLGLSSIPLAGWIKTARKGTRIAGQLAAVNDGVNKFMAQSTPGLAAELYKNIEGKKGKVNSES